MVAFALDIPLPQIQQFCRHHHIHRMSLFGSVLGPAFTPDSDVDILVEFVKGQSPGLEFIDMQNELSALLGGRKVDLVTEKFLNHRIRQSVLKSVVVVYEG